MRPVTDRDLGWPVLMNQPVRTFTRLYSYVPQSKNFRGSYCAIIHLSHLFVKRVFFFFFFLENAGPWQSHDRSAWLGRSISA